MRTVEDLAAFIANQPGIVRLLAAVEALQIDDCWIGAGLLRNAVWDHLHGLPQAGARDVDVVYCDHADICIERDLAIEGRLANAIRGMCWSVRNQARMHARNFDPPYRDTADAIWH